MTDSKKEDALREEGTLNPRPERVTSERFRVGDFFDPRDLVQVKYEMLRRVRVEDVAVSQAAEEFGFSRPSFYEAHGSFEQEGIAGLVPRKRGPRGPHKLRADVMAFLEALVNPGQPIRARDLAAKVSEEFGLAIHPRTIERALGPRKKKP